MWSKVTRRRLFELAAALAAVGIAEPLLARAASDPTPPCPPDLTPPDTALVPFVDVHCHVFNASDLPIADYLERGLIREKVRPGTLGLLLPAITSFARLEGNLRPELVFFDRLVKAYSIKAHAESELIANKIPLPARDDSAVLKTMLLALRGAATAAGTPPPTLPQLLKPKGFLADALAFFTGRSVKETIVYGLLNDFLATVESDTTALGRAAQKLVDHVFAVDITTPDATERQAAYFTRAAVDFTQPRKVLVDKLACLYTEGDARLRVFTPSVNDFEYWLTERTADSPAITSIPEQIDVLSKLSTDQPANRIVHGFVPFDPLREVVDGTALKRVRDAIEKQGFLGVKLYPPMGFLPLGNADLAKQRSIYREDTDAKFGVVAAGRFAKAGINGSVAQGAALDEALLTLYDYCNRNHVPIMAHSSRTQGSFGSGRWGDKSDPRWYTASLRADPIHWRLVLNAFPTLRLNLGHGGGIWCLGAKDVREMRDGRSGATERDSAFEGRCELDDAALPGTDLQARWPVEMFRMMSEPSPSDPSKPHFPNLYADVSDWSEPGEVVFYRQLLAKGPDRRTQRNLEREIAKLDPQVTRAFAALTKFLDDKTPTGAMKEFRPDIIRKRLMYGTDWIVMAHSDAAHLFYEGMKQRLSPLWRIAGFKEDFFGGNAVRFLGLAGTSLPQPTGQRPANPALPPTLAHLRVETAGLGTDPRTRLTAFYEANGLAAKAATVLAALDAVKSA